MKFTLSWLKEYLETEEGLDTIAAALTMIGLEVERVDDPAPRLSLFKSVLVEEVEPHPNADRLRVCLVDTGDTKISVVCGAHNVRSGMKAVFAPAGATVPGTGMVLSKTVIRGVESNGMLVSEREMGLSHEHDGIIDLSQDVPVGVPFARIFGLDDPVVDIAVTPNRADCLSVLGIARDLAAAGLGRLKTRPLVPVDSDVPPSVQVMIDLGDQARLCPAFAWCHVRGVQNGPSPDWLRQRLHAIGLNSINALVDMTNFMTFDCGRPLHVFDAAKINGNLQVRLARRGEKMLALDGRVHELEAGMLVIADDYGIVSIAGIMGGERTGCDEMTTDVLIESALWDPLCIARTGRRLGIDSDARYRFERGVDPAFVIPGLERATRLTLDLCGGVASSLSVAGHVPDAERVVHFDPRQVRRLSGLSTDDDEIGAVLNALGFLTSWHEGETFDVSVPSWRADVTTQADLVEEVVRIVGVDKVPSVPLPRPDAVIGSIQTIGQRRRGLARRNLAARGLAEAMTWSFISEAHATCFGGGQRELELVNPISPDMSHMRPGLLPGLINAVRRNVDRGFADVALFEVGQVYRGLRPDDQLMMAAGVRHGISHVNGAGRHWQDETKPVGVFDAKADALAVLESLGLSVGNLRVLSDVAPSWFHPGRSAAVRLDPQTDLAWFGELHPDVLDLFDVSGPLVGFEIFLDAAPVSRSGSVRTKPHLQLYDLQPVRRDFAFVVENDVKADELIRAARGADKALIVDVRLFDVFEGGALEGRKSLAIEVTLQPKDKTLTDADLESVSEKIVARVGAATGGVLRK